MAERIPFPFEIKSIAKDEDKLIKKCYKAFKRPFIKVGPQNYVMVAGYADHAEDIYNVEVRSDDIWVASYTRSGTTWLQEMVWLLANDLDYDGASAELLNKRFAYIEYPMQAKDKPNSPRAPLSSNNIGATLNDFRNLHTLPSPRYVKTHLNMKFLPPKLLDTAKVIYIARDPLDVAVSFYFMHQLFGYIEESVEFKEFWELYKRGLGNFTVMHGSISTHVQEAWMMRQHPNMLFLFYEDMQKDLRKVIGRVTAFLGKEYTDEQKNKLANQLQFDNMKKNHKGSTSTNPELKFIRKGKSGNWVQYFDTEEIKKEAKEYMMKYLEDTDLVFPTVD